MYHRGTKAQLHLLLPRGFAHLLSKRAEVLKKRPSELALNVVVDWLEQTCEPEDFEAAKKVNREAEEQAYANRIEGRRNAFRW
jgi:hypothetical protein